MKRVGLVVVAMLAAMAFGPGEAVAKPLPKGIYKAKRTAFTTTDAYWTPSSGREVWDVEKGLCSPPGCINRQIDPNGQDYTYTAPTIFDLHKSGASSLKAKTTTSQRKNCDNTEVHVRVRIKVTDTGRRLGPVLLGKLVATRLKATFHWSWPASFTQTDQIPAGTATAKYKAKLLSTGSWKHTPLPTSWDDTYCTSI